MEKWNASEKVGSRIQGQQAAKMPPVGFIALALGSIALSAGLSLSRRKDLATFVGLWAPTLMLFGIYNKIVKLEPSEKFQDESDRAA